MRRRTITLVVVGLVLALFVLPAAAQELFVEASPSLEDASDAATYELNYNYDPDSHVVFYGIGELPGEGDETPPLDCTLPEGVTVEVDEETGEVTYVVEVGEEPYVLSEGCRAVLIEGPNGQVNHGQFVSNMVHDLKADYDKDVYGPFGQWVKEFAHDKEIGKGDLKVWANDDDELVELEVAELDGDEADGVKPVKSNRGSEKSNNGKGKGKNK